MNSTSDSSSPPSPDSPPSSTPPPSSSSSSSSPPPSSNSSPPPPGSSPPPPSPQNSNSSPPPPSPQNSDSSPPPPSPQNSNSSPPPPPSPQNSKSSPPPPPKSSNGSPPSHPPPPPLSNRSHHSPPSSKVPSKSSSPWESLSTPVIMGIAGGGALLLLVMVGMIVSCVKKKKKRSRDNMQMQFFRDDSRGAKDSGYYNSGPQYAVPIIPPPPAAAAAAAQGGWAARPPMAPHPGISSGDRSSNYSSGPYLPPQPPPHPSVALGFSKSTFSYDELAAATGGFSVSNMVGQGGFGHVYKGVLPTGKEIAVKSLKAGSGQGEREFQAEVEIISRVHHRHLVSLVGHCIAGSKRLLIYEFVPNETLEHHLHGKDRPVMDWASRMRIALGSAKGLAYLHEDCHPRIIHRDIKASNILLDYNWEAKVADFGLAKLSSDNSTHVSTRVMGTFGYLAPEYASSGKLTEKSDVFSFGVTLLEMITGKRPMDGFDDEGDCLVESARPLLLSAIEDGKYEGLVDPRLGNSYNPQEMASMIGCAAVSVRQSAKRRPKMSQIVRALEGDVSLDDLDGGVKPGHSAVFSSNASSDSDVGSYTTEMKRLKNAGLSSQEFTNEYGKSVEYGAPQSREPARPW